MMVEITFDENDIEEILKVHLAKQGKNAKSITL